MKKLAFGALCIGLLSVAACGGGGGDRVDTIITHIDGGDGSNLVCNVATNTGCAAGQKCTWVRVSVGATADLQLGQVGCVMDGTVPTGGACTYGTSGVNTGFDDCVGGDICLAPRTAENAQGTCKEICSLADTSNPCEANFACGAYQKYFSNNSMEDPLAGVCDPTCNPLTQVRDSDSAPSCGDATPGDHTDSGSVACYGLPSRTTAPSHFSCSSIIDMDPNMPGIQNNNTHRVKPLFADGSDALCLNCCAPGNAPLYIESDAVQEIVCFAYCKPAPTSTTTPGNANGDTTLPAGDPGAWTCQRMGAVDAAEECRYLWFFESAFTTAEVPISPASDAYGFCWDPTQYGYDDDMNTGTPDIPWPSCTTRMDGVAGPNGAFYWGCVPSTSAPAKPHGQVNSARPSARLFWSPDQTNQAAKDWFESN